MSQFAKTYDLPDRGQVLMIKTKVEDLKERKMIPCLEIYTEIEGELLNMTIETEDSDSEKAFQTFSEETAIKCFDILKGAFIDNDPELPGRSEEE